MIFWIFISYASKLNLTPHIAELYRLGFEIGKPYAHYK